MIIIPFLNGYFIGNIPYFQTNPFGKHLDKTAEKKSSFFWEVRRDMVQIYLSQTFSVAIYISHSSLNRIQKTFSEADRTKNTKPLLQYYSLAGEFLQCQTGLFFFFTPNGCLNGRYHCLADHHFLGGNSNDQ